MLWKPPVPSRFSSRPFFALLPAVVASMVFSYYSQPSAPALGAAIGAPAGAEMMQMVRDEHALIAGYLKSNRERRHQADLAAEQETLQAKATERAELLAAREPRQAETRALAAQTAEKPKRKVAAIQGAQELSSQAPNKTAAAMPLQLVQVADAGAPVIVARREEGPIRSRLHRIATVVKRIPTWAYAAAEWIADAVPSTSLTQLPDLHILRASI